jgi:Transposase
VPMLEGRVEHVIGVDTHRDSHAAAILDPAGGLIAQVEIPSSQAGYEQLLRFAAERAAGRRCWALEGTGCYGAGLASFLADHGEWVTEIDRPKRTGRTQACATPTSWPSSWPTMTPASPGTSGAVPCPAATTGPSFPGTWKPTLRLSILAGLRAMSWFGPYPASTNGSCSGGSSSRRRDEISPTVGG